MKPIDPSRRTVADLFRSLIYPTVPILGVITIWAYAYAGSLESKVRRDLEPRPGDTYFMPAPGIARSQKLPVPTDPVASIENQD